MVVEKRYKSDKKAIGILMLNTTFPRLKGDIGNDDTFAFPTVKYVVQNANSDNVVLKTTDGLLPQFVEGAKQLEKQGVRAITTSCGFLSVYQNEIAESVSVPVATSALLMLPFISRLIGRKQVGILTANKDTLGSRHFTACGAENIPKEIMGMEGTEFYKMYVRGESHADITVMGTEIYNCAKKLIKTNKDIGALLLECTNMPPFSGELYKFGIPVFDVITLVHFLYSGFYVG